MIRKFNYTGRRRITRDRIDISIIDDKPHKSFTATLNLDGLGLPSNAKIYIEPYYKSSFMRFAFGTVEKYEKPESTALSDIPSTSIVLFRVKVVDESKELGRIICLGDRIKPRGLEESTRNRMSILHIDWDKDLDQQIFRISFPDNDFPRLEINSRMANAKEIVMSDQIFRSLAFPVAIRQVADRIARTWHDFDNGDNSWQATWLKFIKSVLRVNVDFDFADDDNEDEIEHWVEQVVSSFCRKNRFRNVYEQILSK